MDIESLVGKKAGSLYVVSQVDNKVYCYCSNCGNNHIEYSYNKMKYYISNNKNITCGCEFEIQSHSSQNLIGKTSNKLTIIKQVNDKTVKCRCECGKILDINISEFEKKTISMCKDCTIKDVTDKKHNEYLLLTNRYGKELYYIWSSFKDLYNNPTDEFQCTILDKHIKFFPELDDKEDSFQSFYYWAITSDYGNDGRVSLIRIDESKDYSFDNCVWYYQTSNDFVKLGKNNIDETINSCSKELLISALKTEKYMSDNRKAGTLTSYEIQNEIKDKADKNSLFNYLLGKYDLKQIPKNIKFEIYHLRNGTSSKYGNLIISYSDLLDMFLYYEDDLKEANKRNERKKEITNQERLVYNLSIVVLNIDDYNSRKKSMYQQQDQRTDGELLDVRKYIRVVTDSQKERDEEIEMVNKIVAELEKNDDDVYDESWLDELFK